MQKHKNHILIIDDDTRIRELLSKYLIENGYYVSLAADTCEAKLKLKDFKFDALIVDLMLPGELGTEFTVNIRKTSNVPILMLTAMGDVADRIKGLECGADDYLPKPFEPRELILRLNSILQRNDANRTRKVSLKFGGFTYEVPTMTLRKNGIEVGLTSKERELFSVLVGYVNQPVAREDIAKVCGGINERSVDVTITRIRNKIEADPKNPEHLKTVWGKGYVLYAE